MPEDGDGLFRKSAFSKTHAEWPATAQRRAEVVRPGRVHGGGKEPAGDEDDGAGWAGAGGGGGAAMAHGVMVSMMRRTEKTAQSILPVRPWPGFPILQLYGCIHVHLILFVLDEA